MSSFLCDPYQIGALTAYAVHEMPWGYLSHELGEDSTHGMARALASFLAEWNWRSVAARYADSELGLPGPNRCNTNEADYVRRSVAWALFLADGPTCTSPLEIWGAARCLEYQSCDADNWTKAPGFRWAQSIRLHATERILAERNIKSETWTMDTTREACDFVEAEVPVLRVVG